MTVEEIRARRASERAAVERIARLLLDGCRPTYSGEVGVAAAAASGRTRDACVRDAQVVLRELEARGVVIGEHVPPARSRSGIARRYYRLVA